MNRGVLRFVAVCLAAIVVVVIAVESAEACKRRASRRARRAAACRCEACRASENESASQDATGDEVPPPPSDNGTQSPSDVPPEAPSDESPATPPTDEAPEQRSNEAPAEQPAERPEEPPVDEPETPPAEVPTPDDDIPQPAESRFPLSDEELRDLFEGLPPAPREGGEPGGEEAPPSAKPQAEIQPLLDDDALRDLFDGLPPAPREEADPDAERAAPPIDPPPLEEPRPEPAPDDPFGGASATEPAMRLWRDNTGKYQVQARLVGKRVDAVELEKASGRTVVVPLRRLSDDDVLYVTQTSTPPGDTSPRIVAH